MATLWKCLAEPGGYPSGPAHAARTTHAPAIKSTWRLGVCDVNCNEAVPFRPYCAGVATRTRNVSEYILLLALCLVYGIYRRPPSQGSCTATWHCQYAIHEKNWSHNISRGVYYFGKLSSSLVEYVHCTAKRQCFNWSAARIGIGKRRFSVFAPGKYNCSMI